DVVERRVGALRSDAHHLILSRGRARRERKGGARKNSDQMLLHSPSPWLVVSQGLRLLPLGFLATFPSQVGGKEATASLRAGTSKDFLRRTFFLDTPLV